MYRARPRSRLLGNTSCNGLLSSQRHIASSTTFASRLAQRLTILPGKILPADLNVVQRLDHAQEQFAFLAVRRGLDHLATRAWLQQAANVNRSSLCITTLKLPEKQSP